MSINSTNSTNERLKRKHLPKTTIGFEEVVFNVSARMKCGTSNTEVWILAFLDECRKVAFARKRLIVPNFADISIEVKPPKRNNIKVRKGMTESEKKAVPIVPKHYVAKIKPHVAFKKYVGDKKV